MTIEKMGTYLSNLEEAKPDTPGIEVNRHMVKLTSGGKENKNIFLVHDGSGETNGYHLFCGHLKSNYNFFGLRFREDISEVICPQNLTIEDIASGYAKSIKEPRETGPSYIGGWSLGGLIDFEVVRQLEEAGIEVGNLFMFDTTPPVKKNEELNFTIASEIQLIDSLLEKPGFIEDISGISSMEILWDKVLHLLEHDERYDKEFFKDRFGNIVEMITDFDDLPSRKILAHINAFRTLSNAASNYYPTSKIKTKLYYYIPEISPNAPDKWQEFCREPIEIHSTTGGHMTMFKGSHAEYLSALFREVDLYGRIQKHIN